MIDLHIVLSAVCSAGLVVLRRARDTDQERAPQRPRKRRRYRCQLPRAVCYRAAGDIHPRSPNHYGDAALVPGVRRGDGGRGGVLRRQRLGRRLQRRVRRLWGRRGGGRGGGAGVARHAAAAAHAARHRAVAARPLRDRGGRVPPSLDAVLSLPASLRGAPAGAGERGVVRQADPLGVRGAAHAPARHARQLQVPLLRHTRQAHRQQRRAPRRARR
ncbi:hypothetical protein O3G_MSEX013919 [Manduca sexta]|uniref:Uncharacterized protein n=1 Tax=Manduca sexta TaxID=7130 RepID=A0A922CZ71_MANSE|nr:hypothetical protein O3G_MSEX013919 [Manduca sexta]